MQAATGSEHFNGLTPGEAERLAWLAEECGEVIQAIGKILRHGYESYNPTVGRNEQITNRQGLMREAGDVLAALRWMVTHNDVAKLTLEARADAKTISVQQWMHHQ